MLFPVLIFLHIHTYAFSRVIKHCLFCVLSSSYEFENMKYKALFCDTVHYHLSNAFFVYVLMIEIKNFGTFCSIDTLYSDIQNSCITCFLTLD